MKKFIFCVIGVSIYASGCGGTSTGNPLVEDSSTSGTVAGVVGGAVSGTSAGGTQASVSVPKASIWASLGSALNFIPDALASVVCPTFLSQQGSGCTASGGTLWLTYGSCNFVASAATWSGTQSLIMSSGSASCGHFPYSGASGNLIRQYVSGASSVTPSTATVTSRFGTVTTVDDASSNLQNFDGDAITTLVNGGYGTKVSYGALGLRNSVSIARRIYVSGGFDHSITGQVTIGEAASGSTSRSLSGSIKIYHNILKVVGTSTLSNVTHSDGCCFPNAGSITTAFAAGNNVQPTAKGSAYVGKSETLTFTGCGTASLQAIDGTTSDVTLSRCF